MKNFSRVLVGVLALSLMVGCSSNKDSASDCKVTSVLVTDSSGVNDKSFNELTHDGLVRFEKEFKDKGACNKKSIESATDAEYVPNLTTVSNGKSDIVVAAGYKFEQAMKEVALKNPKQNYLILDVEIDVPNISSAVFAANEGSFLVGVAAAKKAQEANKKTVGFIGGDVGPAIDEFKNGFVQGVKAVDSSIEVKVQYVGSFTDTTKAKIIAQQMYSKGAYIIYQAAGNAGNGVINAAKELKKDKNQDVWVIGVDRDQYENGVYDGDKSIILTSMLKRVDEASYQVSKSILDGTFKPGQTLMFDLANDGVGIPENNPNLSDEIVKVVKEYKDKIIKKEIKVKK